MDVVRVPDWWQLALLGLAAFRLARLVGWDTITASARGWATLPDATYELWHEPITSELAAGNDPWSEPSPAPFPRWRWKLAELVRCPWCAGFWLSGGVWAAWTFWPRATLWCGTWLALSSLVGLVAKHLDQ